MLQQIFSWSFDGIRKFNMIFWWNSSIFCDSLTEFLFLRNLLVEFLLSQRSFDRTPVFFCDLLKVFLFFPRSFEGILVFSGIFWRKSRFFHDFFYHDTLTEFLFLPRFFEAIRVFIAILWRNSSDLRPFFKWWNSRFIPQSFDEIIDFFRGPSTKIFFPRLFNGIHVFSATHWRNSSFLCDSLSKFIYIYISLLYE